MSTREEMERLAKSRFKAMGYVLDSIVLVDDRRVDYGYPDNIYVRRPDLFTMQDDALQAVLVGNPTWVHLNLLKSRDGSAVVTVTCGPSADPVGGAESALNVSVERRPLVIEAD